MLPACGACRSKEQPRSLCTACGREAGARTCMEGFSRWPRLEVVCRGSCPSIIVCGLMSRKASITTCQAERHTVVKRFQQEDEHLETCSRVVRLSTRQQPSQTLKRSYISYVRQYVS